MNRRKLAAVPPPAPEPPKHPVTATWLASTFDVLFGCDDQDPAQFLDSFASDAWIIEDAIRGEPNHRAEQADALWRLAQRMRAAGDMLRQIAELRKFEAGEVRQ